MSRQFIALFLQEMFYSFMLDRYCIEDVMFMAAHDFLSAVEKFSEQDKVRCDTNVI